MGSAKGDKVGWRRRRRKRTLQASLLLQRRRSRNGREGVTLAARDGVEEDKEGGGTEKTNWGSFGSEIRRRIAQSRNGSQCKALNNDLGTEADI